MKLVRFAIAVVLLSAAAYAQEPQKGGAGGPPAGGPPPPPKPAEQMKTLKFLEGKWSCGGKVTIAGMGTMDSKATYVLKRDLGDFWLTGRMTSPATKQNPMSHLEQDYWTFNPESGSFVRVAFDNFGDMSQSKAAAWAGDKLEFTGEATAMGKQAPYAFAFIKESEKALKINGTIGPAAQPIVQVSYSCKK